MLAPICLFVYNRLDETRQTIEALKNNYLAKESELFIFSDGSKNKNTIQKIEEVRLYLKFIDGFKSIKIIESKNNKGLANSIISGVSEIIKEYGKVIVLEDDLITTPNFITFMNEALHFYKNNSRVQSINAYSLAIGSKNDVYFQMRPFPWGWATWSTHWNIELFDKKRLKKSIEHDSKVLKKMQNKLGPDMPKMLMDSINQINDSWYARWAYDHFVNMNLSVYPSKSLIVNIGFAEQSTHCRGINTYVSELDNDIQRKFNFKEEVSLSIIEENTFLKYFSKMYKLKYRLLLIFKKPGRHQLINELKMRLNR